MDLDSAKREATEFELFQTRWLAMLEENKDTWGYSLFNVRARCYSEPPR